MFGATLGRATLSPDGTFTSFKDRTPFVGEIFAAALHVSSAPPTSVELPVVTTFKPAAVLWDMDGTILDSEPYWMSAETSLVESWGGAWSHELGLTLVGLGLNNSAQVLQDHGVGLTKAEIIDFLTNSVMEQVAVAIPWRPGARELLLELKELNVPTALVTMSFRSLAELVASSIGFHAFDVVVTGDEVSIPKPHPEAYLTAAQSLNVSIERCVAIEDSVPGVTSAVASGAFTISVPHLVEVPEAETHTTWNTLAGRTANDLSTAFTKARS
jgi:HAD superfamily hydrolase (TIGR01509 family)